MFATKSGTSSRTCCKHNSWNSATWFVSQTFMICVCDFVANLSQILLQSRRNGIWALIGHQCCHGQEAGWGGKLLPKFLAFRKLSENYFLVQKFLSENCHLKMLNLGVRKSFCGNEGAKSKFPAAMIFYHKSATVCWNSVRNLRCLSKNCNFLHHLLF